MFPVLRHATRSATTLVGGRGAAMMRSGVRTWASSATPTAFSHAPATRPSGMFSSPSQLHPLRAFTASSRALWRRSDDANDSDGAASGSDSDDTPRVIIDHVGGGADAAEDSNALLNPRRGVVPHHVPAIPLTRRPVFPGVITPVLLTDEKLAEAVLKRRDMGRSHVGLFLSRDPDKEIDVLKDVDQIHSVGSLGQILRIVPGQKMGTQVLFVGLSRIQITGLWEKPSEDNPFLTVTVRRLLDEPLQDVDKAMIKAYSVETLSTVKEILRHSPFFKEQLQAVLEHLDFNNPSELADLGAILTTAEAPQLQEVLECTNVHERLSKSLLLLKKELDLSKLQQEINKQLEEKISNNQRKYFLMEQMKTIKKELGMEKDEKESLLQKYRERMEGLKLTPEVEKVVEEELTKLSMLEPAASEYNVTRNYLDWLTVLPWGKTTKENLKLDHAQVVLDEDHYGLKDIKERILEFIAVGNLKGTVRGKILCFVGPPGVGKTSIGRSIARALDREFYRFSVGGMSDVAEIKGHRRTYVGAMPGKIIQSLKLTKSCNPVILIDEVDKMAKGWSGDPSSALLEVLDPEQNASFSDHYLDVPFDLSQVLFVCTANTAETIPEPLLDRMEVIPLAGYVLEEKTQIAKRYLVPEAKRDAGLSNKTVTLRDSAIVELIRSYCRESGVRNLQKQLEKIFRKVAYKVATGAEEHVAVGKKNLQEFVGKPVFTSDRFYARTPRGVTMGLAWTSMGGAALYIETTTASTGGAGKGSLRTTGMMGDVMRESTEIAYTFSKHMLRKVDKKNKFFDREEVHLHVPEGATPKDGPSAGVTMVTSLMSLATGMRVDNNVAMTGELTLTGRVLPIGGVKEKSIVAKRSGVKTIIFPEGNRKDFEELDEQITAGLTPHFVRTYDEVFKVAFAEALAKKEAKEAKAAAKAAAKQ